MKCSVDRTVLRMSLPLSIRLLSRSGARASTAGRHHRHPILAGVSSMHADAPRRSRPSVRSTRSGGVQASPSGTNGRLPVTSLASGSGAGGLVIVATGEA
jgi:hypothetical protein